MQIRRTLADITNSKARFAAVMVAAWAAVRLLLFPQIETEQVGDALYYLAIANNLHEHGIHGLGLEPTATRPPIYPAFIYLVGFLPGNLVYNVIAVQSVLSLLTALYAFASLYPRNRTLACLWGLFLAASPFTAIWDFSLYSESLQTSILLTAFTFAVVRPGPFSPLRAAISGLLFALLCLARDTYLFFPPALFLLLYLLKQASLRTATTAILSFLICLAPWAARNYLVVPGSGFSLSQGLLGPNLWIGTWERDIQWTIDRKYPDYAFRSAEEEARAYELYRDGFITDDPDYFKRLAMRNISEDPLGTLGTWLYRVPRLWTGTRSDFTTFKPERWSVGWILIKAVLFGLNSLLILLAAAGAVLGLRESRSTLLYLLPPAYVAGVHLPFHVESRYSSPVVIFLYYLAAVAVVHIILAIRRRQERRAGA